MSDGEKKLSGENAAMGDNANRDTVFYYSRERRLSRASARVQEMNDGQYVRPSLSKTLFATRGHKLLFATIILFCIVYGMTSRFSGKGGAGVKLGGNTVVLTIVPVEGTLVLGINKETPKSGEFYIGAVDIAVSPVVPKPKEGEERKDTPVFSHRISFNPVESEIFNLSLPFSGNDFFVILKTDTEHKSLRMRAREINKNKK